MPHLSVPKGDIEAINRHYKYCQDTQEPYVLCLRRRTRANVEFDHISLDPSVDVVLDKNQILIRDGASEIFRRYACKSARYDISAKVMWMKDLRVDDAERIAAELFSMIKEVIYPSRPSCCETPT